jgi:4'-phosphopantetheinyl transferase EntD
VSPPWEPWDVFDPPRGIVRAVAIPEEAPPAFVIASLTPGERAFSAAFPPARHSTWVAGRLALASALSALGAPRASLLADARGAPLLPRGFVGSVSHKRQIAVALATVDEGARVGVDVEDLGPLRQDISRRVLTAAEHAAVDALLPEARWDAVKIRFSIKESIYKALDPFVQRYVGFKEAEIDLGPPVAVRLSLAGGEGPFAVEATWTEIEGRVVSTAWIRRAHEAQT